MVAREGRADTLHLGDSMHLFQSRVVLVGVLLAAAMPTRHVVAQPAPASAVELLRREAAALGSVVESKLARNVLEATAELPAISPRTRFVDEARRRYFTEAAAASLGSEARGKLARFPVDETFYYT